jgi:hypothetical protein
MLFTGRESDRHIRIGRGSSDNRTAVWKTGRCIVLTVVFPLPAWATSASFDPQNGNRRIIFDAYAVGSCQYKLINKPLTMIAENGSLQRAFIGFLRLLAFLFIFSMRAMLAIIEDRGKIDTGTIKYHSKRCEDLGTAFG